MTEGRTRKFFFAVIIAFLLAIGVLAAQSQVLRCTEKMLPIPDECLQRSIDELKLKNPSISFQADDPCTHAKFTAAALTKTLRRNYLKHVSGYEFVKVINGDWYFTIERFRIQNLKDLKGLETALKNRPFFKLETEENTRLAYFIAGDSIVFMISSAIGCEDNSGKFQQLQQFFLSFAEAKAEK